jgi:hypothetical protein
MKGHVEVSVLPGCGVNNQPQQPELACGSEESNPLSRFPRESRGGDGSPHGTTRSAPAKSTVTLRAGASPRKRDFKALC